MLSGRDSQIFPVEFFFRESLRFHCFNPRKSYQEDGTSWVNVSSATTLKSESFCTVFLSCDRHFTFHFACNSWKIVFVSVFLKHISNFCGKKLGNYVLPPIFSILSPMIESQHRFSWTYLRKICCNPSPDLPLRRWDFEQHSEIILELVVFSSVLDTNFGFTWGCFGIRLMTKPWQISLIS